MQLLPIGIQTFDKISRNNFLYVDKTGILANLINNGAAYFLARPRRFGKSLTISTIKSMFSGETVLFEGLEAEEWVSKNARYNHPVISIDMSSFDTPSTAKELNDYIIENLENIADELNVNFRVSTSCGNSLKNLILALKKKYNTVVVLVDEYDKPILDNIHNPERLLEFREKLHSFYTVLKSCDEYLRFVFITGISKFSKLGIFSGMNNLIDITLSPKFSNIVGYTENELKKFFAPYLDFISTNNNLSQQDLFKHLKFYYDGYSFDGQTRVYNPFSILCFFNEGYFNNYWYESGSPTFLIKWLEKQNILDPECYRHVQVANDFTSAREIEQADINNFLFQTGYLTIEKREDNIFTLDYPNFEVKSSMSRLYLENFYKVNSSVVLGKKIWSALKNEDLSEAINIYNTSLKLIPYDDFAKRDEYWYRSLFIMLLYGAGIITYSEVHTYKGRSDIAIELNGKIFILEFKFAKNKKYLKEKQKEGLNQLIKNDYASGYKLTATKVIQAVIVAVDSARQALVYSL